MVGTEQDSNHALPSNGDTVIGASVHSHESNADVVVLPREDEKNKNEASGTEVGKNGNDSSPVDSRSSDDSQFTRSVEHENDTRNSTSELPDPHRANFSSHGIKEKCGSNTYTVSSDDGITMYRGEVIDVSDDSDSSDSETSSTVSEDNEDSDTSIRSSSDRSDTENKKTSRMTRTKGEFTVQDLPPIEDLKISVDENKCKPVGSVLNIVDEMVVIQSFPNTPPLDIDTVLFLDRGQRALGKIFDVFGQVQEPFYSVRFNSREHIQEKDIRREQVVYCAPQTEYTSYVQVSQLLREKGSDASWTDNNEPPETYLEYSDDESEARHKRPKVNIGSKRDLPSDNDLFVNKMNQKNLELTAKRKKEDEAKQKRGSALRKEMAGSGIGTGERLMSAVAHSFSPFSNSRAFSNSGNGSQACSSSFFHHPAASAVMVNTHSTPPSKFESGAAPRAVNYLRNAVAPAVTAISYLPPPPLPLNYAFPTPQHFMCSSPRQLPNQPQPPSTAAAAAATQNYFAMCHHQQAPTGLGLTAPTTVLSMVQPTFSTFTAASIPPMPTFVTQPQPKAHQPQTPHQAVLQPAMPPSFNTFVPPPPSPFASFNAKPTPPLPSSLPQPNFFTARTDVGSPQVHHPTAFIPLNMRPAGPPTYHPQFVLPLPPPPPPPPVNLPPTHQQHQRDMTTGSRMPDRRMPQQSSHRTTNNFYSSSPTNS